MAFAAMIEALFADPTLTKAAEYLPKGGLGGMSVRVIAKQPDTLSSFGEAQIHTATGLFDVQAKDVPQPAIDDQLTVDGIRRKGNRVMTTTPNLLIDHIAAAQAQKEVTANTAFDALDKALCQFTSIALTDANQTLADAQMLGNMALKFTGVLTATRTVTVPAHAKLLFVENGTTGGFSLSIKTPSGTAVTLGNGERKLLYCNGSDFSVVAEAGVATPYDVGGCYVGKPSAGSVILRYPMPRAVRFAAGLSSSTGVAATAATAAVSFSIRKNGAEFATMNFAASATIATFTCAGAVDFAAGNVLTLVAPSSPDDTLSDIGFALAGLRI